MNKFFFPCLCFLNFLPVWLIVVLLDVKSIWFDHSVSVGAEWCSLVGIGVGFSASIPVVTREFLRKRKTSTIVLDSVNEQKSLSADILLSYVLPLLAFELTTWLGLSQFLVFFMLIAWMSWKHSHFSGNVVLALCGYRFYMCVDEKGRETLVLHRGYLGSSEGLTISVCKINDQVCFTKFGAA